LGALILSCCSHAIILIVCSCILILYHRLIIIHVSIYLNVILIRFKILSRVKFIILKVLDNNMMCLERSNYSFSRNPFYSTLYDNYTGKPQFILHRLDQSEFEISFRENPIYFDLRFIMIGTWNHRDS
jgi:hypothetical protein